MSSSSSSSGSLPPPRPGLKFWRRYRDLTQAQVAAELGVSQGSISRWEHDGRRATVEHARRLKAILQAPSIEALFPGDDENGAAA